jgi:hypothetical protein
MTGNFDPARYEALIERLLDIQRHESSLDPLSASFEALSAVVEFLNADTRLVENEATTLLVRLFLALHDWRRGAKPKLLFDAPSRKRAKGGAPTHTSAVILREYVNAAFLILCEAMSQQEASRWLATELKHAGIEQSNGHAIDARVIIRWRAERGGKSPKGSDETFAMLVLGAQRNLAEKYSYDDDAPITRQQAQVGASFFIERLKLAGF